MRHVRACTALVAGAVVVSQAAGATTMDASARSVRAWQLGPGVAVRIRAGVGNVQVLGSDRTDVLVRIERRAAAGASLSRLEERADLGPSALEVSVLESDAGHDARLTSTVVVEVPRAQPIAMLELFEGTARLRGLSAGASVRVTRGSIEASDVSGPIRFETTMGPVRVVHAAASLADAVRLRTFNGDIDLTLPEPPPNARILALTLNGAIASTLPLTTRTTVGPRFSEATFGSGAPVVNLDAVNGNIRLATARP